MITRRAPFARGLNVVRIVYTAWWTGAVGSSAT